MPCSLSLPQQIEQSVIKEKLLFAGFRKIFSEVQKSSCIVHRCTVYDFIAKKEAGCKWILTGSGGRSGDISCQIEDVSYRRPHKARKSWYTKFVNL